MGHSAAVIGCTALEEGPLDNGRLARGGVFAWAMDRPQMGRGRALRKVTQLCVLTAHKMLPLGLNWYFNGVSY